MTDRWLTTKQAGDRIQMSAAYVSRQCATGELRAKRLGTAWRISERDLEIFMTGEPARPARVRTARQRRAANRTGLSATG